MAFAVVGAFSNFWLLLGMRWGLIVEKAGAEAVQQKQVIKKSLFKRTHDYVSKNKGAFFWILLGLLLMGVTEPLQIGINNQYEAKVAVKDPSQRPTSQQIANRERLVDLVANFVEHFGTVLFVAMIIRLGIEAGAQERASAEAQEAMKALLRERLAEAFQKVDERVGAFVQTVNEVNESIAKVQDSVKTMEKIVSGRLYLKLEGTAKEQFEKNILDPVFIRPLYKLHLNIAPPKQPDGEFNTGADLVEVTISTDYSIENWTSVDQPHEIRATLDNVLFSSKTRQMRRQSEFLKCEFGEDTVPGRQAAARRPFDLKQLEAEKLIRDVGDDRQFEYTPPEPVPAGKIYFVAMKSTQFMRDSDAFYWNMRLPTEVLELEVKLDGGLSTENFSVRAIPVHHGDHNDFRVDDKKDPTFLKWKIDGVLLPYQGVQLWWSRLEKSPEPSSQTK